MTGSTIKYANKMYMYGQGAVSPVSNPVIYGRFPKYITRKTPVEKLNKILTVFLIGLVMLSLVSYYFVSDREKTMNNLGHEIVTLSNENIELQNKIDNMHSFEKVDEYIHNKTLLDTAKKVIEIPAVNIAQAPKPQAMPVNYKWSIGY